ncbi:MAG: DUF192 domain-containing protein [Rhodobacteraceae bacterium]|nr:DUF192 domain-containing protein [Paracoccaceae bacterium]
MSRLSSVVLLALLLVCGAFAPPAAAASSRLKACSIDEVSVRGDWGQMRFRVDVADDDAERGQGLMFVEQMDRDKGMIFLWDEPQHARFWMRNTYIPLDMLFVAAKGVVKHIHHEAVPRDDTIIDGGPGTLAVLEINGGMSRSFGIDVGSELQHPAFGEDAAWPCD